MNHILDPSYKGTRLNSEIVDQYIGQGMWSPDPLHRYVEKAASLFPDRIAAITCGAEDRREIDYRDFYQLVEHLRSGLQQLGVGRGDVVSIMLPNIHEFGALIFATSAAGAIYSGIPVSTGQNDAIALASKVGAKALCIPESFRGRDFLPLGSELLNACDSIENVVVVNRLPKELSGSDKWTSFEELASTPIVSAPREVLPGDLVHLGFTSGTSGTPKSVMNTHQTLDAVLRNWVEHIGRETFGEIPVNVIVSPIGHHSGFLWGVLMTTYLGGTSLYVERWEVDRVRKIIRNEGGSTMIGAPTFLHDLVTIDSNGVEDDLASMRIIAIPGAPIPRQLVPDARALLHCFICPSWGMTEYGIGVSTHPRMPTAEVDSTDGVPVKNCQVRIVDEATRAPLAQGELGSLEITGPGLFLGYLDQPDATSEAIVDGWLSTGDLAVQFPDGSIELTGRTKDIIIRGGEKIPVSVVENLLFQHPSIHEVALVGYPDERLGERACAVVVLAKPTSLDLPEIVSFLTSRGLSIHHLPERVEIVDELPKTASGKVRKVEIRSWLAKGAPSTTS